MAIWTCLLATVLLGWWLFKRRPVTSANSSTIRPQGLLDRLAEAERRILAQRYTKSVHHYESLLRFKPNSTTFRQLLQLHVAAGAYEPALAASLRFQQALPTDFAETDLALQAHLYVSTGQHRRAVAIYTSLLAQPTPLPVAYNNRGYAYLMLTEYAQAIPDFNQAIAVDSYTAYAYNNRGLARLRLGQAVEGQADIEHGLRLDPHNAYAHRNLGICYFERGDYAAALLHFERAQRLDQSPPLLADYIQQTRQHLGFPPATDEPPISSSNS